MKPFEKEIKSTLIERQSLIPRTLVTPSALNQSTGAEQGLIEQQLHQVDTIMRISVLESSIAEINKKIAPLLAEVLSEDTTELRDISYAKAKEEIAKYFEDHHGETINAADLQEALGIDISMAMKICEELKQAGEIKEA